MPEMEGEFWAINPFLLAKTSYSLSIIWLFGAIFLFKDRTFAKYQ